MYGKYTIIPDIGDFIFQTSEALLFSGLIFTWCSLKTGFVSLCLVENISGEKTTAITRSITEMFISAILTSDTDWAIGFWKKWKEKETVKE